LWDLAFGNPEGFPQRCGTGHYWLSPIPNVFIVCAGYFQSLSSVLGIVKVIHPQRNILLMFIQLLTKHFFLDKRWTTVCNGDSGGGFVSASAVVQKYFIHVRHQIYHLASFKFISLVSYFQEL